MKNSKMFWVFIFISISFMSGFLLSACGGCKSADDCAKDEVCVAERSTDTEGECKNVNDL